MFLSCVYETRHVRTRTRVWLISVHAAGRRGVPLCQTIVRTRPQTVTWSVYYCTTIVGRGIFPKNRLVQRLSRGQGWTKFGDDRDGAVMKWKFRALTRRPRLANRYDQTRPLVVDDRVNMNWRVPISQATAINLIS